MAINRVTFCNYICLDTSKRIKIKFPSLLYNAAVQAVRHLILRDLLAVCLLKLLLPAKTPNVKARPQYSSNEPMRISFVHKMTEMLRRISNFRLRFIFKYKQFILGTCKSFFIKGWIINQMKCEWIYHVLLV